MTTRRLALILILCVSTAAQAAPQLSVSELAWDFGGVESGSAAPHAFVLRNDGDTAVVIDKVTTSCGCTTAPLATPYTLDPNETVDLTVTLHVSGAGEVARRVTVTSNDPASPLHLTVKATALPKTVPALSPADLAEDYYLLLDLRTPEEYAGGHILGAMSFPYADLGTWGPTLPADTLVIVYDLDGAIAPQAVQALRIIGVSQAFYLNGGYARWSEIHPALSTSTDAASEGFVAPPSAPTTASPEMVAVNAEDLHSIFTVLVDLRDAPFFAAGHLAGAANVPASELPAWTSSLPRDLNLVLYGDADEATSAAATLSANSGMTQVSTLALGLSGWRAAHGDLLLVRVP